MSVRSLGQEDPLEKDMATHSSLLAWEIPWTEKPGGLYSPLRHKESNMTGHTYIFFYFEPKGNVDLKDTDSFKNSKIMSEIAI